METLDAKHKHRVVESNSVIILMITDTFGDVGSWLCSVFLCLQMAPDLETGRSIVLSARTFWMSTHFVLAP